MKGLLIGLAMVAAMPQTVMEYSNRHPKMPETVQEYMDRGRAETQNRQRPKEQPQGDVFEALAVNDAPTEEIAVNEPKIEGMTFYANMELTAYIETGNCCADGVYPEVGYTAACNDPALWHRWVYIDGVGTRYIHDTGGMGYGVIDVYVGDYNSAIQFGRQTANVYLMEE